MSSNQEGPNAADPIDRYYTIDELKTIFRVSKMTVYRAIRDGDIKAIPFRNRLVIAQDEFDRLKQSGVPRRARETDPGSEASQAPDDASSGAAPQPGP